MTKDNGNYGDPNWWKRNPLSALKHHVSGAVERGEAEPIVEQPVNHAEQNAKGWLQEIVSLVSQLDSTVTLSTEYDEVEQRIQESPLSVMVRTGWFRPGALGDAELDEYELLLTTGGPGLRLTGNLDDYGQPDDWPRLEYQDWGTPWTEYLPAREHREALQKFASVFYYGDN
jgi:hypothetical protein